MGFDYFTLPRSFFQNVFYIITSHELMYFVLGQCNYERKSAAMVLTCKPCFYCTQQGIVFNSIVMEQ